MSICPLDLQSYRQLPDCQFSRSILNIKSLIHSNYMLILVYVHSEAKLPVCAFSLQEFNCMPLSHKRKRGIVLEILTLPPAISFKECLL